MENSKQSVKVQGTHMINLKSVAGNAAISFNLQDVKMNDKQKLIVNKLFSQHPEAEITTKHDSNAERGVLGPGSKYLTPDEFEQIRRLGVRIGGAADPGPILDFCLHVIVVGALNQGEMEE